jgi:hypothetical protein
MSFGGGTYLPYDLDPFDPLANVVQGDDHVGRRLPHLPVHPARHRVGDFVPGRFERAGELIASRPGGADGEDVTVGLQRSRPGRMAA